MTTAHKNLIALVERMEASLYILPDAWSEGTLLSGEKYKTYVGSRGPSRYMEVQFPEVNVSIRGGEFTSLVSAGKTAPSHADIRRLLNAILIDRTTYIKNGEAIKLALAQRTREKERHDTEMKRLDATIEGLRGKGKKV